MAAMMMKMMLLGVASAAYQGGGDATYNTEDEHLGHGGPGGNGAAVDDESATGTSPAPSNRWPTASASHQGGGVQTYHTADEHLGHGAPVGYGSIGVDQAAVFVVGIFFGVLLTVAAWYAFTFKKSEKPEQKPELEMTVGADLEEAVERKESKTSQISIAASDVPLTAPM
jgi:hypothetical protein